MCIAPQIQYNTIRKIPIPIPVPDHRHMNYDIPHDPTEACCICCVISKRFIILELLKELGTLIPLIFTTQIMDEIKEEIEDFYEENPLTKKFIPARINLVMSFIITNNM